MADTTKAGRSAESVLEDGAGGEFHRAVALEDLYSAACGAEEEFAYDTSDAAADLVRLCRDLRAHLARLSVTENADLTLYRECGRCSGNGKTTGEDPCVECGGSGSVHADQADDFDAASGDSREPSA